MASASIEQAGADLSTTVTLTDDRDVSRRLPMFDTCAMLGLAGLLFAIGARRPEIIALAAPFVIAVAVALARWRPFEGTVRITPEVTRVVEGDEVTFNVEVHSAIGIDRVEVELFPSDRLAELGSMRAVTTVRPGFTAKLSFTVKAVAWGVASIQKMEVRVSDRFGMFGGKATAHPQTRVTIGLPEDRISASLEAERFRRIVGSHLSEDRGQGLEIADVRPFQPGDSTKNINWRISNRRQEPWVTLRHPDRSTTLIIIVDAHDGESSDQQATQRRSVAAAMALSRGHLAMHDRVGLLVVGHTLQWLAPRLGRNQLFEIADQLVAVSNAPEASRRMYRPPAVSAIPSNAIVVAVSPLRDPLMVALIAEIRSRGNPVSVLVPENADEAKPKRTRRNRVDTQARRLAAAEQSIGVESLRERGVAIVPWAEGEPVVSVVAAAQRLRSSMARMR